MSELRGKGSVGAPKFPNVGVEAMCVLMASDDRNVCTRYSPQGWLAVLEDVRRQLAKFDAESEELFVKWLKAWPSGLHGTQGKDQR